MRQTAALLFSPQTDAAAMIERSVPVCIQPERIRNQHPDIDIESGYGLVYAKIFHFITHRHRDC